MPPMRGHSATFRPRVGARDKARRLQVYGRREGSRVRSFTRGGYDRFPAIVEAASRLKAQSFLIDGEAVVCRHDGISDFNALRYRRGDQDASLIAFDLI